MWVPQYVLHSVHADASDRCDFLHSINISCHFDNLVKTSVSWYITVKMEKTVSYNLPIKKSNPNLNKNSM